MTPEEQAALYRWDNLADDHEVYNEIFETALCMVQSDVPGIRMTGSLLMIIINEWEKSRRSIPMSVVSAAYSVVQEFQSIADNPQSLIEDALRLASLIDDLAKQAAQGSQQ